MQSLLRLTYLALVVLLPATFMATTSELFELPKFLLLLTCAIIVLFGYLTSCLQEKKLKLTLGRYPLVSYGVLVVLVTQAVATLFSEHPYTSFFGYYSRFHQGLLSTICYTVIYFGALKFLTLRDIQKLLKASLATALIISVLAIGERFNLSVTCPLINPSLEAKVRPPTFSRANFSNSCWKTLTNPTSRSFATLGQPNWLAAYLLPHIFLLLYLSEQKKKRSITLITSYCLLLIAIWFTKSRSGYLALGVGALSYIVLKLRQSGREALRPFIPYLLSLLVILALALLPFTKSKVDDQHAPVPSTEQVASTSSGDIRKIVWSGALQLFIKRPILGFGPETFAYTYYEVRPVSHNYTTEWDYLYNKAHNEYLNMAATTGLVGLLGYLFWHYTIWNTAWTIIPLSKKTRQDEDRFLRSFLPALGASLLTIAVTNFFGFSVVPVYLLLTLLASFAGVQENAHPDPPAYLTLTAIFIMAIAILALPLRFLLSDLHFTRGKALAANSRPNEAKQEFMSALRLRPNEDLYHSYLGETYAELGEVELAKHEIAVTLSHNPYHLNYYKSRAKSWISLATKSPEYYASAIAELEAASRLAPTDPKLFYNLGLLYSRIGNIDKSTASLKHALDLKKDYYDPYYALTLLYESSKNLGPIKPLLEQAQGNLKVVPAPLQEKIAKYLTP